MKIADADTAENQSGSQNCVVTPVYCAVPRGPNDPPALHDLHPIRLLAGSRLRFLYGGLEIIEEGYFCNYQLNPEYLPRFEAAGMRVAAVAAGGEVRAVELPEHRFYIATLFHPQLGSRPGRPHPFVTAFVNAARALSASA